MIEAPPAQAITDDFRPLINRAVKIPEVVSRPSLYFFGGRAGVDPIHAGAVKLLAIRSEQPVDAVLHRHSPGMRPLSKRKNMRIGILRIYNHCQEKCFVAISLTVKFSPDRCLGEDGRRLCRLRNIPRRSLARPDSGGGNQR